MLRVGLRRGLTGIIAALAGTLAAVPAFAQDPIIDTGSTAWMITATALVLLMTIPGLALFYGGMFSGFVLIRERIALDIAIKIGVLLAIIVTVDIAWLLAGAAMTRFFRDPRTNRIINVSFAVLLIASVAAALLL